MEKIGSFVSNSYDILDFSWEKLVAFESHLAVQQPSELKLVAVSLKYLSSTLLSPLSSWTGLNHAATKHPRREQSVAGIKQRVLMARSRTFWFCISLNQASRAGDIHQVHHGVLSKLYLIASIVFIAYFSWQRCVATASEWKRWQRRCDRLTKLQQRIKFPLLKSITVEGVTHNLPLKSVGPPERNPSLNICWFFWWGWMCVHEAPKWRNLFCKSAKA